MRGSRGSRSRCRAERQRLAPPHAGYRVGNTSRDRGSRGEFGFDRPGAPVGSGQLAKGADKRTIPANQVTWSPVAISFVIPTDLPVSAGIASWEIRVQATGSTEICGPYALSILAVPVLIFVPPTCVSE